jgi:hypothetical protein
MPKWRSRVQSGTKMYEASEVGHETRFSGNRAGYGVVLAPPLDAAEHVSAFQHAKEAEPEE